MARPSILTDYFIADFCQKLRISGSIETAIKATGIGRETYYGWARKVAAGGGSAMMKRFIREVEGAEGEVKLVREHMLSKHFDKNWQALAWWLERKYSPEYGQRRPPPLPDPDAQSGERTVDRVVWVKAAAKPEPAPNETKGDVGETNAAEDESNGPESETNADPGETDAQETPTEEQPC